MNELAAKFQLTHVASSDEVAVAEVSAKYSILLPSFGKTAAHDDIVVHKVEAVDDEEEQVNDSAMQRSSASPTSSSH